MKVLIVDNSRVMRQIVTRTLRQAGYTELDLVEASNGLEAYDVVQKESPDLVLCDWNMPEMNGLEFISAARKTHKTPIVMLTTEGTADKSQQALAAGADAYLTKPFTPEVLQQKLKLLLNL